MAPRTKMQKRAILMVEARNYVSSEDEAPTDTELMADLNEDDDRIMFISDEEVETLLSKLQWKEGAGAHLRKAYNGTGRSTMFARKAIMKKREQTMKGCRSLTSYFAKQGSPESECSPKTSESIVCNIDGTNDSADPLDTDVDSDNSNSSLVLKLMDDAIQRLGDIVRLNNSSDLDRKSRHSKFDHVRYLCILRFLELVRQNPRSRIQSSRGIAKSVYGLDKGGEYKARCIRLWSDEFVQNGHLMPLRQGKHQKSSSLLDDADIKQSCLDYLRTRRVELIDAASFSQWVSNDLHKVESLGLLRPARISERTARRWLHRLGFECKEYRKGTYTDGHERPDVVEYRTR